VRWTGIVAAAVIGAGCVDAHVTQALMVVESDIEARERLLLVSPLDQEDSRPSQSPARFPYLVVITPDAQMHPFGVSVQLRPDDGSQLVIIARNARDVAFVAGQRRMFVMPLHARCACQGTSCPNPGDPDCDDLRAPALVPLDERASRWPDRVIDLTGEGSF
jgi:hypothetical protein